LFQVFHLFQSGAASDQAGEPAKDSAKDQAEVEGINQSAD
jgi:hypothetical protein